MTNEQRKRIDALAREARMGQGEILAIAREVSRNFALPTIDDLTETEADQLLVAIPALALCS